ncbi:MAG: carboxypeptidase regulatory-like domain-containing protein [Candidatus Omnitrophica bacterium]|nr:carboxypeptidase regulatory-like domain-containing protein [Candidatus Omnitrophota bacterium]
MKKILIAIIFGLALGSRAFANGSITGTVTYNGPLPHERLIHMDADPVCYAVNKGNLHSSPIVVGDNNTLGNVFVFIKSGLSKTNYPPPSRPVVINQAGCNYNPHVVGVMVGQKVKFLNPDGTLHNVHGLCKINPEFNDAMPDFRKEMEKVFYKPEFMFPLRCDVHPWMQAWVAVMPHPFFAVTNATGRFEIDNIPNGTYTIEAWHERLGTRTATVTVTYNSRQNIDFTFTRPK